MTIIFMNGRSWLSGKFVTLSSVHFIPHHMHIQPAHPTHSSTYPPSKFRDRNDDKYGTVREASWKPGWVFHQNILSNPQRCDLSPKCGTRTVITVSLDDGPYLTNALVYSDGTVCISILACGLCSIDIAALLIPSISTHQGMINTATKTLERDGCLYTPWKLLWISYLITLGISILSIPTAHQRYLPPILWYTEPRKSRQRGCSEGGPHRSSR